MNCIANTLHQSLMPFLLTLVLLTTISTPTVRAQELSDAVELQVLFSSLNDNTLNSDFFLDETLITGAQKEKLQAFVSGLKARIAKISLREEVDDKSTLSIEKELIQERTRAFEELNSILLPHQVIELRSLFHQRSMLSRFGCESFQLPRLILRSLDCPAGAIKETSKKLESIASNRISNLEFTPAKKGIFEKVPGS